MKIKLTDLTRIHQVLTDAFLKDKTIQSEVAFLYDFYWTPSLGERHDLYNKPELTIGSIAHDLERISQCLADNEPMLEYFRYLGNILIAIADTAQQGNQV